VNEQPHLEGVRA